uniref:Interleukin-1 n=1 Tax=Lutjanus sanguineus TaxID=264213 RepID=A0A0A7CCY1_9TELE|nr:interleukin-1 [Lutjanus sanguineus]
MESEMTCNVSEMWSSKMPEGLDIEVTQHPLTMKSVVNLIIAMERLKGSTSESHRGTEFRDENLLSIMLESIVEEQTVFERNSAAHQYKKGLVREHSVTDSENRHLVHVPDSMELHAVRLQGGSEGTNKVCLNMASYAQLRPTTDALPVALSIKGTNFYLSCRKEGEKPTLHLEAVENGSGLSSISQNSDMVRFLFYKQDSGLNNSTLASVPYSDWFISTAEEDNRPVEMCQDESERHRVFHMLPK